MSRPRLLDAFCCQGGAAQGYYNAGFEVVGVDKDPQPRYPFEFHRGDAINYILDHGHKFDAIHASPPCQHAAAVTAWRGDRAKHPNLIQPTRDALNATGRPWVMENVPEADVRPDFMLCGSMFGLKVRRHRVFEVNWPIPFGLIPQCHHDGLLPFEHKAERAYADALGCPWMTTDGGRQAIPPRYTQHIGTQLLSALQVAA